MNGHHVQFWTVSILDRDDPEMDVWTHIFSTEQKADDFILKVQEKLKKYDVDTVTVTKDFTENIDDDFYLDWLDQRYGECVKMIAMSERSGSDIAVYG